MSTKQRKTLIFVIFLFALIVVAGNYFASRSRRGAAPTPQTVPITETGRLELSPEVLESLTPPPGAEPIELSPEVLESFIPPPDAEPIELSPEVLESLTPPAR